MPVNILINGVDGSDESAVDFDGTTSIVLSSGVSTGAYSWEFLDWPLGSAYTHSWLQTQGVTNSTVTIPSADKEGSWLVKLTDTSDNSSETIVVGVKHRRTNLRAPAAGETTETSNITYSGATNHRGWALRRNYDLDILDDLVTSGGIQICYLDDDTYSGSTFAAGSVVALKKDFSYVIDPTTGEEVPRVILAQASRASDAYRYYGVIKAGRVADGSNPGAHQYTYANRNIPNGTFVWVSRAGFVEGGDAGYLDFDGTVAATATVTVHTGTAADLDDTAATVTLMADSGTMVADQVITIGNSDGTTHTITCKALGAGVASTATQLNIDNVSNASQFATQIKASLDAAASAKNIDMTVSAVTNNSGGDPRVITLTQKTTGTAGNTAVSGTLVSGGASAKIKVNQTTADGAQGTLAFSGGVNGRITLTSTDGTVKNYVFDDDNAGATGTLDGSGNVYVQINGLSTAATIATQFENAIEASLGHNGRITVANSGAGTLTLTQATVGQSGNTTSTTNITQDGTKITVGSFSGGSGGYALGDLVYVSGTTAGAVAKYSDPFATGSDAGEIMIPIGIVVEATNPGKIALYPNIFATGVANGQRTWKFLGIGDYSSVRIGRSDGATIANEEDGTIEMVGTNQESVTINRGQVVCISTVGVYLADSSLNLAGSPRRREGIFGIAVDNVAAGEVGHFTIYGPATAITTYYGADTTYYKEAKAGRVAYVGTSAGTSSSRGYAAGLGQLQEITGSTDLANKLSSSYKNPFEVAVIPLGIIDADGRIIMGTHRVEGFVDKLRSGRSLYKVNPDQMDGEVLNSSNLLFEEATTYAGYADVEIYDHRQAHVSVPNSQYDQNMYPVTLFESNVPGDELLNIPASGDPTLNGKLLNNDSITFVAGTDWTITSANNNTTAASLQTIINGHPSFTATVSNNVITVTQVSYGANTTTIAGSNATGITVTAFTGGSSSAAATATITVADASTLGATASVAIVPTPHLSAAAQFVSGSSLYNATWNPDTPQTVPGRNKLYTTISVDSRFLRNHSSAKLKVTGYCLNGAAGTIPIALYKRDNFADYTSEAYNTMKVENVTSVNTGSPTMFTLDYDLFGYKAGSTDRYYNLSTLTANKDKVGINLVEAAFDLVYDPYSVSKEWVTADSVDIVLTRATDTVNTGIVITGVSLVGTSFTKQFALDESLGQLSLYEYQQPGYSLVDVSGSVQHNIANDSSAVASVATCGADMSSASSHTTGTYAGFIPYSGDNRFNKTQTLDFYILGKYKGGSGAAATTTTLTANAAIGDTTITVGPGHGFANGNKLVINYKGVTSTDLFEAVIGASTQEIVTVSNVSSNTLTLSTALTKAHASGATVQLCQSIDLDVTLRHESLDADTDSNIKTGTYETKSVSAVPIGSTATSYELVLFKASFTGATTNPETSDLIGARFLIERTGTNPLTLAGDNSRTGEDFFQIANVKVEQVNWVNSNTPTYRENSRREDVTDVFELKYNGATLVEHSSETYRLTKSGHIVGYNMSNDDSFSLPITLDKRYSKRDVIRVDVLATVSGSLGTAADDFFTVNFRNAFDEYGIEETAASGEDIYWDLQQTQYGDRQLGTADFDHSHTAPGSGKYKNVKLSFTVPPELVWKLNKVNEVANTGMLPNPNTIGFEQTRNPHNAIILSVYRKGTGADDIIVQSVTVSASRGYAASSESAYIDISEDPSKPVVVPGAYHSTVIPSTWQFSNLAADTHASQTLRRGVVTSNNTARIASIATSAYRHTWSFGIAGSKVLYGKKAPEVDGGYARVVSHGQNRYGGSVRAGEVTQTNEIWLPPAGMASPVEQPWLGQIPIGHLVPFNIIVLGVSGWGINATRDVANTASDLLQEISLELHLVQVPGSPESALSTDNYVPGATNFPLVVTSDYDGTWRWSGSTLSTQQLNNQQHPIYYLPADYSTKGNTGTKIPSAVRHMLCIKMRNESETTMQPIAHVDIEIAMVPTHVRGAF